MERILSESHKKKRRALAKVLAEHAKTPKSGYGSEVDRLAIDVLYELLLANKKSDDFYTPEFQKLIAPYNGFVIKRPIAVES